MPTYITLANYTNQGVKNIKESVKANEEAVKIAEEMGEKVIGFYHIMGEYESQSHFQLKILKWHDFLMLPP